MPRVGRGFFGGPPRKKCGFPFGFLFEAPKIVAFDKAKPSEAARLPSGLRNFQRSTAEIRHSALQVWMGTLSVA